tara:strand:- start:1560 stop:2906 length:1347 start_codon:yes stop_codon:yes gene_type:complete
MLTKINNQNILNLISWFISLIPIILIFSNSIADIIVVLASIFFIFHSVKKNNWNWLNEPWIKIGLIIYFWLIISSFFAFDKDLALSRSTAWIRFIFFAASLQFLFLSKNKFKNRLIVCGFIGLAYVNCEMFIEHITGSSLYAKFRFHFVDGILFNGGHSRITGPFKDSPKSGIYLAYFMFPIILGIGQMIKIKFSKNLSLIFAFLFLVINLYLVYLSGHRASMLFVIISLLMTLVYIFFKKRKTASIFIIFLILIGLIFNKFNLFNQEKLKAKELFNKTYTEISDYSNSAYGSLSLTSFKMFKSKPLFGIGLKNYRVACEKDEFLSKGHLGTGYGVSPWKGHFNQGLQTYYQATCSSHPHNLYLTWLAETGFLGFCLFLILLFIISKKILKNKKIINEEIIVFGILLSLIPKLIPMMPSLNFFSNWNAVCFWLLIGWLLSFYKSENKF